MAAPTRRVMALALSVALIVWLWALAAVLFAVRWNSVTRPGPPIRELFPYGELRIGVDASNPPFAVATADDLYGLEIDLGRALGAEMGIPVRFVNMGYDGLYDSIRADQVDIVIAQLLYDPLLTADVRYTRPYYNAGLVLVSPAMQPLESMNALPGHSLAYEYGSQADAEARRWLRRVRPFDQRPYELPVYALDAVRLGAADAALVDATSARLYLRDHADWQAAMQPVTDELYVIAARINRVTMWARVDTALEALTSSGTLDRIIARWL